MNIKRIFGAILTIVGAFGLAYALVLFVDTPDGTQDGNVLVMYGVVGALFLTAGISFIRISRNEA